MKRPVSSIKKKKNSSRELMYMYACVGGTRA